MGRGSPRCAGFDRLPIWASLGAALLTTPNFGCVDPRADYEAFATRPYAQFDAAPIPRSDTPCAQLLAQNLSGTYYASCLPVDLMTAFSLAFHQTVTPSEDGRTAALAMSFSVLASDATDITQTAGELYTLAPTVISEACTYDQPVGTLTLPRSANATGRDLAGENMRLRGRVLTEERACALLSGTVPLLNLQLSKDQDVCVFVRRSPGEPLPALLVPDDYGCNADGLPTL